MSDSPEHVQHTSDRITQLEADLAELRRQAAKNEEMSQAFARANAHAAELYVELDDKNEELQKLKEQLEWEMRAASDVQKAILFPELPSIPGLTLVVRSEPASLINGDLVVVHPIDRYNTAIMVADGLGHGVPAALMSIMARSFFISICAHHASAAAIFTELNRVLKSHLYEGGYITAFVIVYNSQTHLLRYSGAGHPRIIYWKSKDCRLEYLEADDPVLGVVPDHRYNEKMFRVDVGDRVYLCTDGISESRNASREFFGEDRFIELLRENCQGRSIGDNEKDVFAALAEFEKGAERVDDQTFVAVEFLETLAEDNLDTVLNNLTSEGSRHAFARVFKMGVELIRARDYETGARVFERLISIEPHNVRAHFNLGFARNYLNDRIGARESWQRAQHEIEKARIEGHVTPGMKAISERIDVLLEDRP